MRMLAEIKNLQVQSSKLSRSSEISILLEGDAEV